ncbi:MAG: hypothetical protein QNK23_05170 [Crocinitomicaceae bacterium]|nr:hypothetical protein [Crocinitomicaceae bacterium]
MCLSCVSQNSRDNKLITTTYTANDLIKTYEGTVELPIDLLNTYTDFVNTIKDTTDLQKLLIDFCIADSVIITTEIRPEEQREWEMGEDMNIPFLLNSFSPEILGLRQDSKNEYLIRTVTTAFRFMKSNDSAWKIFYYLDKPIE